MNTTKDIQYWWSQLSLLGTTSITDEQELFRIKFLNQSLLITQLSAVVFIAGLLIVQQLGMLLPAIVLPIIITGFQVLIAKGKIALAKHLSTIHFLSIVTWAALTSTEPIAFFSLFPFAVYVYFLHDKTYDIWRYNILSVSCTVAVIIKWVYIDDIPFSLDKYGETMRGTFFLVSEFLLLSLFKRENKTFRTSLQRQQYLFDQSQALANIGSWTFQSRTGRFRVSKQLATMLGLENTGQLAIENDFLAQLCEKGRDLLKSYLADPHAKEAQVETLCKLGTKEHQIMVKLICGKTTLHSSNTHPDYYGIVVDLTASEEMKQIQTQAQALTQLNHELKRSNEDLENFAYIASHDFQEPLRMIGNFIGLLEEEYSHQLNDEGKSYIRYATDGARRMSRLMDELLQYSRVDKKQLHMEEVDIESLFKEISANLANFLQARGAILTFADMPKTVRCESVHLYLIFTNLIQNAVKFNKSDVPTVRISGYQDATYWHFACTDNGIGIAPENHEKIFKLFKRLHRKEEFDGTGIGLAMVRRIAQRYGGSVSVASALGKGTTFHFSIAKQPLATMQGQTA